MLTQVNDRMSKTVEQTNLSCDRTNRAKGTKGNMNDTAMPNYLTMVNAFYLDIYIVFTP